MELFAPHAQVTLTMLALTGTVFGVLALVVKRKAIGAAIRRGCLWKGMIGPLT